jgi:hypothetical protein
MAIVANDQHSSFWIEKAGYLLWLFIGLLCAATGLFHPIADLADLFIWSAVALVLLGMFLSMSSGDASGFCALVGFGGFLIAMYGVGFEITAALIGQTILAVVAAAVLYAMGVLGILGA